MSPQRILQLADKLDASVYSGNRENAVRESDDTPIITAGERYELAVEVRKLVQQVYHEPPPTD